MKFGFAAVAAFMAATASPAVASGGQAVGEVQRAMEQIAEVPGVVGALAGSYQDGVAVGHGTAGSRLLDGHGGPIPVDSRFRIASQTKTMTAVIVLQLVDEKRVGLEDRLATVLPEVTDLVDRADEITVRQLIQHTSGVPDYFSPPGSVEPAFDVFDFTTYYPPIDVVASSRGWPRTGAPGEKFNYSNTNYTLLGMIAEKLTGQPLADEFDRRLFGPLQMTKSYYTTKPPEGIVGPHGHGYYPDATGRLRDVHRFNTSWANGAGAVVSTTRDVSRFQRAFYQGTLLPAELRDVLTSGPATATRSSECGDLRLYGGSAPGFTVLTFASTDARRQIVVSVTRTTVDDMPIIDATFRAVEDVICA
ncbi:serine hydrolase [Amycolatopsis sp. 195334CR]|uniref:serine hydrolase domain-containing protein n=1 Tax=Amycolatopsis sp. 195334CR TaxID=2814588 RepID=UPI001A8F112E|nr:serine hydrolase domain-containing protein [Amycolatopsis sp. 195334CR]MBN6033704.1 beta-lactamase family protein [Amycolatopsis sp. 195334CR]